MKAQIPEKLGKLVGKDLKIAPVTEEEIAEAVADARAFREKLTSGISTQGKARARYAAKIEIDVRNLLVNSKSPEEFDKYARLLSRVLRDQGRYEEALEYWQDEGLIEAKVALDRDDDDFCDCGVQFKIKEVFSEKYGGAVRLWTCVQCGHKNVTHEVPETMKKIVEARGKIVAKGKELNDSHFLP